MSEIQNINLQKLFSAPVYQRGMQYYRQGRVRDLLYDMNYNVWTARVYGTENYFVEIDMTEFDHGTIKPYCDCPAFSEYGPCKHIAAGLIAISENELPGSSNVRTYDYQAADRLIDAISAIQHRPAATEIIPQKEELRVEYYLKWTYDHLLLLELKTGVKRAYVIKNVQAFLRDVLSGNEHYFTKTFTYSPDTHYFPKEDIAIFDMLYSILRNEQIYLEQLYQRYTTSSNRSVIVPPIMAKTLLEKLMDRELNVEVRENNYKQVSMAEGDLPFQFSISKNERDEMILSLDETQPITYFDMYEMLFLDGSFYFPTKEQLPIVEQLNSNVGTRNQRLPITKEQSDAFVSEVLPTLKKVGAVNIAENVASEIIQAPLQAKLYLDIKADWITGRLEYHYGGQEINPLNNQKQSDVIIIRDVNKEQQIMRLIEYANFHYNGKELYIEADEDELYEFLYHVLPMFESYVELFLTSEIRSFLVENTPEPSTSVNVETSSNLLDVGFTIDGIDDDEVSQILNAVMEKKRYYRLQSGALLSLEGEEYTSLKTFFTEMDIDKSDVQDGNVQMPVYRGTQIDELLDIKKDYDPSFRKLLHQLKSPEEQVFPLPDGLQATLRDYQNTGYQWFKSLSNYHLGGILADDMGLGKTLQAISYIASETADKPHLIIAPSSVLYNWKNECSKFAPDLSAIIMIGSPAERKQLIENTAVDKDVWITSYSTLRQDIALYRELSFQTLILDEAQYIKNYATKTSKAIREVKASRRFALSGTPIENSIDELWAIFQVILPGLMPNQRTFKQMSYDKISMLTKPFILRRVKQDVLKELPDKIESVHVSDLTKEQKELYLGYLRELQQEAAQSMKENGFQKNRMKILAGLTRLRQICCHPSMFIENYEGKSGKLEQLMETVHNALENGKRMLIFSQFTSMHEIIIQHLEAKGLDYFYLNGSTPSKERVEMADRFNNGEKDLFLISLKAGGTGLNLTGADTVILYDLWWNPAVEDQATGRAHRFGQKNVVQVIRLITEGTIEEKIYDLQQKKRELIDQVIKPGEKMLSSLTEDDIRELLNL